MNSKYLCKDCQAPACDFEPCKEMNAWLEKAEEALKLQDTIVYCKDCKYFATDDMVGTFCKKYGKYVKAKDFCSQGERK